MTVISLLTDFGTRDGFVGIMKGVIWGIAPQVQIADISHEVQPQNILQGALTLAQSWQYFPAGSIHVAVVDPGVGTHRRALAARLREHFFVLPDNGLITLPYQQALAQNWPVQLVQLDNPEFWLPRVSRTFHGRDIFAPAAAHIARGVPLDKLGSSLSKPVLLDIPQAQVTGEGYHAQVMMIDVFGNLITNLSEEQLSGRKVVSVTCEGVTTSRFVDTFGEGSHGELVAMIDSAGYLSLCEVNGNAAARLKAGVGSPVEVRLSQR